jgi:hypothetical protein
MAKELPPPAAGRVCPTDTKVIVEGFKRVFPVALDDPFQKLILAIDAADAAKT